MREIRLKIILLLIINDNEEDGEDDNDYNYLMFVLADFINERTRNIFSGLRVNNDGMA